MQEDTYYRGYRISNDLGNQVVNIYVDAELVDTVNSVQEAKTTIDEYLDAI